MTNKINVSHLDIVKLVQVAYNLSKPQGMGFLHYEPQPMTYEEAKDIVKGRNTISLDYVKGRAVQFNVFVDEGVQYISGRWFDHSDEELSKLLRLAAE